MKPLGSALLALVLVAASVPLAAQSIRGRVINETDRGVPEATVAVVDNGARQAPRVRTGTDGTFVLPLSAPGVYRLRVERTGYASTTSQEFSVGAAEVVEVVVRVAVQPVGLDPLTVTGRQGPRRTPALESSGFYEREARGLGRYLRREELERRRGARLAQVLDDVPGIRLYRDRRGNEFVTVTSAQSNGALSRAQRGEVNVCQPQFYLDGTLVSSGSPDAASGISINDLVQPEDIEAIEVYGIASRIPPQYNGSNAACGVVLIWTRKGR